MLKGVLLKQSKISRYFISTPHWIHHHKVALTPSYRSYPAGKALLRRSSFRANSEVTFASQEGKEAFPSRPDPKALSVCAVCFQSLVKMTASIIFLIYLYLNGTYMLLSKQNMLEQPPSMLLLMKVNT